MGILFRVRDFTECVSGPKHWTRANKLGNMGILPMVNRTIASVGAYTNVKRMDETETVVLYVCVTMSQEDTIFSHVYLYVYVVSLITKLFYKFKP